MRTGTIVFLERRINIAVDGVGWWTPILAVQGFVPTQTTIRLQCPLLIARREVRMARENELREPFIIQRWARPTLRYVMIIMIPLNVESAISRATLRRHGAV